MSDEKFGADNCSMVLGDDGVLTIQVDTKRTIGKRGDYKDAHAAEHGTGRMSAEEYRGIKSNVRAQDLIGTSRGISQCGAVKVSVNVMR